jgi:hypothetical protein
MGIDFMSKDGKQFFFSKYSMFGNADFYVLSHNNRYPREVGIREDNINPIDFFISKIFFYGFFYL